MATGHIRLGVPGALRDYQLVDPKRRVKSLANPMAAKLGEGSGDYNDFQNWAGWLMEDWQAGLGKKDPTAGGFLYATAETRFPNRLMLSPIPILTDKRYATNWQYQAGYHQPDTELAIGAAGAYRKFSQQFTADTDQTFALLLKNEGINLRFRIYSNTAGAPGTVILNGFATPTTESGGIGYSLYRWSPSGLTPGTVYHFSIEPYDEEDDTAHVLIHTAASTINHTYNGSTWTAYTSGYMLLGVNLDTSEANGIRKIIQFNDAIYALADNGLFKLSSSGTWSTITLDPVFEDMIRLGDYLYLSSMTAGAGPQIYTVDTDDTLLGTAVAISGFYASTFASYNGFLWRAEGPNLYYSGDAVTWTGPISVAETGEQIRGMAGQGDYLYVSTDSALYYIGFGDQVRSVTPWPSVDATNGAHMLNHQGSLFIGLGRSLLRFDSGSMLPVGPDLGEGLPALREGTIAAIVSTNYWLLVAINPTTAQSPPTVWAWNSQGWHHITTLFRPGFIVPLYRVLNMVYDRTAATLYIATDTASTVFSVLLPDSANYSAETTQRYSPFGWLETDWFFGGLKEVYKDCESVYVAGDNIDANNYVAVYWQDDDSTDWELLGTVTSTRAELRFDDYSTRPNTRQIKLGLALYSKTAGSTPIVRAVRLKYMAMVQDRWRWSLPIAVSDLQQMVDGKENPYTAVQMRAHLNALLIQVPPFVYQDVDGVQYEVKVMSASEQIERYELIDGAARLQMVYSITVEQAQAGTYSA